MTIAEIVKLIHVILISLSILIVVAVWPGLIGWADEWMDG